MPNDWANCTWGDLATLEYGKALRSYREGSGEYPVYGTNGPIGWHSEYLCPHPGVIVGRKGAYRGIHYCNQPFYVIDTAFYLRPKRDISLKWAYYELLTHDINSMDSGSAIPSTSREAFYQLPVLLPTLREQEAIAEVLGALDDKIELNRQTNQTLEALAQRLFKSWFVDFDPVKAKMAGRTPAHMDAETAALFPDRLVESELGLIPEGWEVRELGALVQNVRDGVKAEAVPPDVAYVGLEHFEKKSLWLASWGLGNEVTSNKSRFQRGDLLFGKLRPYFHKVAIAPIDGVCSTDVLALRAKEADFRSYAYLALFQDEVIDFATRTSTGTRMPRASWKTLATYKIPLPPPPVARAFAEHCDLWLERLVHPSSESRLLAALRDRLLPKLISGQLRVRDAERHVAEVV